RGGRRLEKLFRYHPARSADGPGCAFDQRRADPVVARRLPPARYHEGHGALAADDGDAPGGGHLAALGQPLPASARSPDGRERRRMVRYADDFVILCRTAEEA